MSGISPERQAKAAAYQITIHQIRLYAFENAKAFYQQAVEHKRKNPTSPIADFKDDLKVANTQIKKAEDLLHKWAGLATDPVEDLSPEARLRCAQDELGMWQERQWVAEVNHPVLKRLDDPEVGIAKQETLKAAWMIPLWEEEIKRLDAEMKRLEEKERKRLEEDMAQESTLPEPANN
jgi:hypothetical protein